jgi:hypothetical protein
MATMISEVYDALLSAGAPDDKARKAAEAIAAYESRFAQIDVKLTRIEGELVLVKWMVGAVIAGVVSLMAGVGSIVLKIFH